jgi:hypothetical protein
MKHPTKEQLIGLSCLAAKSFCDAAEREPANSNATVEGWNRRWNLASGQAIYDEAVKIYLQTERDA